MAEQTFLQKAIQDGHAHMSGEGKAEKITYIAVNHTERYSDPEEKVRAEFWAELIYRYNYDPDCIGVEVVVPDRQPNDRADLVIFTDNTRKRPYAVIECKKDDISDAEFDQADPLPASPIFKNRKWGRGNAAMESNKYFSRYQLILPPPKSRALRDFGGG